MADETIIIKVEVDNSQAIAAAAKTKAAIDDLKTKQKELNQARKDGLVSDEAYFRQSTILEASLKKQSAEYGKLSNQIAGTKSFTDKLKDSLGQNSQVADKLTGGLASTASGIVTMTKSAIAFIATPIGLVVAALGAAIGALTAYFKGSEEGQDRLAKGTSVLSFVFEKLMNVVEEVGKVIADTIEFLGSAALKVVNFFAPQMGAMIQEAIKAGSEIADLQDKIEADENALIVRRAEVNRQVAQLREQAIKQEGDAKRATIEEAIRLEKNLAETETQHANDKLAKIDKELAATKNATEEQKKARAEAFAELINQDAQAAESTLRFQKELEKLNDELVKQAENLALVNQAKEHAAGADNTLAETQIKQFDIQTKGITISEKFQKIAVDKTKVADQQAKSEQLVANQFTAQQAALSALSTTFGTASKLFKEGTLAYQAIAIAQATIDTYRSAVAALAPPPVGLGPIFGPFAAGVAIATGLASVAKISGVQFATGGYTGDGGKYEAKGIVHGGEFVIPKETVSAFGPSYFSKYMPYSDGGFVTNQGVSAVNDQMLLSNIWKNMPEIVLGLKEFNEAQTKLNIKQAATSL